MATSPIAISATEKLVSLRDPEIDKCTYCTLRVKSLEATVHRLRSTVIDHALPTTAIVIAPARLVRFSSEGLVDKE